MAMFKPSQSHSGDVIVKPYTSNIAQELQFLTGEKKNNPISRLGSPWQPSNKIIALKKIQASTGIEPMTFVFRVWSIPGQFVVSILP